MSLINNWINFVLELLHSLSTKWFFFKNILEMPTLIAMSIIFRSLSRLENWIDNSYLIIHLRKNKISRLIGTVIKYLYSTHQNLSIEIKKKTCFVSKVFLIIVHLSIRFMKLKKRTHKNVNAAAAVACLISQIFFWIIYVYFCLKEFCAATFISESILMLKKRRIKCILRLIKFLESN